MQKEKKIVNSRVGRFCIYLGAHTNMQLMGQRKTRLIRVNGSIIHLQD